jgi:asparagine synthase (glutamine-hydrolysing)
MCGIAGLVWKTASGKRIEDFKSAANLIAHRGPDGRGEYIDDRILLVHYRLAILDLSTAGSQPYRLAAPKPSIGIYNGELYNYIEIAKRHRIQRQTSCDTEVLLKGLAHRGTGILEQYNGIFAVAQYFPTEPALFLARDRLGVKPLYILDTPDFFAFASEAKVLYAFMDELWLDPQALHEFFTYGSSMSMRTIVSGVEKLPPGSFLRLDLESFQSDSTFYWSVSSQASDCHSHYSYKDIKPRIRTLLSDAVERQCLGDVPIGAYLSGGLDSSMIVALAARRDGQPIKTFSVRFKGSSNSELPLARQVAERYQTDHHELEISPAQLLDDLEGLIFQYDEPFADPAALPLHLMAKKCAPLAKVVLQGDGGDELFAGYGRHLDMSQYWRRLIAFGTLSKLYPNGNVRRRFADRYAPMAAEPLSKRLAQLAGARRGNSISSLLKTPLKEQVLQADPLNTFKEAASLFARRSPVDQVLLTDMMTILPHTFLEKVDKVSMWHSIEARVPFLDNNLVDYLMGVPSQLKIRRGVTKALLRDIASEFLPEHVVDGRKQSFGTPMEIWLRTLLFDYAQSLFHSGQKRWSGILDFQRIKALHREHVECRADHGSVLWRLIVLLVWLNCYAEKIRLPGEDSFSQLRVEPA